MKMIFHPAVALRVGRLHCHCLEAAHRTDTTGGRGWGVERGSIVRLSVPLSVPSDLPSLHYHTTKFAAVWGQISEPPRGQICPLFI